ncbi:hypothetical protein [Streptomyces sp. NPDC054863]
MTKRSTYDESQAAGRLRVPVAAWRWAVHTGQVPAPDAGPGLWTRAAVEAVDAEGVRAALRGPIGASTAADRLTAAVGDPLPVLRPAVTSRQIGDLARAGFLTVLGPDADAPDVHPDQVAALARRRDLEQLLDRHLYLGPEQAAVRLGVRRTELNELRRLGWLRPNRTVTITYSRSRGGPVDVDLYAGLDVALLPLVRYEVDWPVLRAVGKGRRSPLAALAPDEGEHLVSLAGIGRIAGVGRAAVAQWRSLPGFPSPAGGTEASPRFRCADVGPWLLAHRKLALPSTAAC